MQLMGREICRAIVEAAQKLLKGCEFAAIPLVGVCT